MSPALISRQKLPFVSTSPSAECDLHDASAQDTISAWALTLLISKTKIFFLHAFAAIAGQEALLLLISEQPPCSKAEYVAPPAHRRRGLVSPRPKCRRMPLSVVQFDIHLRATKEATRAFGGTCTQMPPTMTILGASRRFLPQSVKLVATGRRSLPPGRPHDLSAAIACRRCSRAGGAEEYSACYLITPQILIHRLSTSPIS